MIFLFTYDPVPGSDKTSNLLLLLLLHKLASFIYPPHSPVLEFDGRATCNLLYWRRRGKGGWIGPSVPPNTTLMMQRETKPWQLHMLACYYRCVMLFCIMLYYITHAEMHAYMSVSMLHKMAYRRFNTQGVVSHVVSV